MAVLLIPSAIFRNPVSTGAISAIGSILPRAITFLPLTNVEQIVKTSGSLLTSFLIQGGGFKFYQGGKSGVQEGIIIKAKLVGSLRFWIKTNLEIMRDKGIILLMFSNKFGIESGFVIKSFEANVNNRDRDVINTTISLQNVVKQGDVARFLQTVGLSAIDAFTDFNAEDGLFNRFFEPFSYMFSSKTSVRATNLAGQQLTDPASTMQPDNANDTTVINGNSKNPSLNYFRD